MPGVYDYATEVYKEDVKNIIAFYSKLPPYTVNKAVCALAFLEYKMFLEDVAALCHAEASQRPNAVYKISPDNLIPKINAVKAKYRG